MYFPRGRLNTPEELSKLGRAWDGFRKAEAALKGVLHELEQDFEGGINLASQVRSRSFFAKRPFVFFTRKGNLLDAIKAYEKTEALSVIKKPDPREEFDSSNRRSVYDNAMNESRDALIRHFDSAIHRSGRWYRYKNYLFTFLGGVAASITAAIITAKFIGCFP